MSRWRQIIGVRGNTLKLLESVSNITVTNPKNNAVILRGVGRYFPDFRGPDWAAMCAPLQPGDVMLDDISPVLEVLIREASLAVTDSPSDEVAAWLRGRETGR